MEEAVDVKSEVHHPENTEVGCPLFADAGVTWTAFGSWPEEMLDHARLSGSEGVIEHLSGCDKYVATAKGRRITLFSSKTYTCIPSTHRPELDSRPDPEPSKMAIALANMSCCVEES